MNLNQRFTDYFRLSISSIEKKLDLSTGYISNFKSGKIKNPSKLVFALKIDMNQYSLLMSYKQCVCAWVCVYVCVYTHIYTYIENNARHNDMLTMIQSLDKSCLFVDADPSSVKKGIKLLLLHLQSGLRIK